MLINNTNLIFIRIIVNDFYQIVIMKNLVWNMSSQLKFCFDESTT